MEYAHREYCNMLLTLRAVIVELVLMHENVRYIILVDIIQMVFFFWTIASASLWYMKCNTYDILNVCYP
jgi:hypothetical protein